MMTTLTLMSLTIDLITLMITLTLMSLTIDLITLMITLTLMSLTIDQDNDDNINTNVTHN